MIVGLASAKGAPGVTTAVLALSAAWPTERSLIVVDLDLAGGDLAAYRGLPVAPNIATLAVELRGARTDDVVARHAQHVWADHPVQLVAGASTPEEASATLDMLLRHDLIAVLRREDCDVLVDCGRLGVATRIDSIVNRLDLLVVVTRPTWAELHHARHLARRHAERISTQLLLIGEKPYDSAGVRDSLALPVLGALVADPAGADALSGLGLARRLERTRVVRSARPVAGAMLQMSRPLAIGELK